MLIFQNIWNNPMLRLVDYKCKSFFELHNWFTRYEYAKWGVRKKEWICRHSCFSCSVKCWVTTMENGCQVTILDSEAQERWNLDWRLAWPSILSYGVLSCIWQVYTEPRHFERPKIGDIHYNRLLGHYYFQFCDSVSRQICDLVKKIFFTNMKGRGIISLSEIECHLVPPIFVFLF